MDENEAKILVAQISARSNLKTALIAGLFGGAVAALATFSVGWFEFSSRDKELNLELAKISLQILSGEYDPEAERNPLPARRFAILSLIQGTGVSLSDDDIETWAKTGATPDFAAIARGIETNSNAYLTAGMDYSHEAFGGIVLGRPNLDHLNCVLDERSRPFCGTIWSYGKPGLCIQSPLGEVQCGRELERKFDLETGEVLVNGTVPNWGE